MKIYLARLRESQDIRTEEHFIIALEVLTSTLFPLSFQTRKDISAPEKRKTLCLRIMRDVCCSQILTKNAEDFIQTAETLQEYGYNEVNLNLGCPSKTVVTKGRGADFWTDRMNWTNSWMRFSVNVI